MESVWLLGQGTILNQTSDFRVILVGLHLGATSDFGDIAIDDVALRPGACPQSMLNHETFCRFSSKKLKNVYS